MKDKNWKNTVQYQRIVEILEDYWTSEPNEALVEIDMKFVHANGEWQSKTICWFNPNMSNEEIQKVIPGRWKRSENNYRKEKRNDRS